MRRLVALLALVPALASAQDASPVTLCAPPTSVVVAWSADDVKTVLATFAYTCKTSPGDDLAVCEALVRLRRALIDGDSARTKVAP